MKTLVRCGDCMVFPINPESLEPLSCSYYDPYCFSSPDPDATYMGYSEWRRARSELCRVNPHYSGPKQCAQGTMGCLERH